jgi:hypothetical protein
MHLMLFGALLLDAPRFDLFLELLTLDTRIITVLGERNSV